MRPGTHSSDGAERHRDDASPAAVVNAYLGALYAGDFDTARALVVDDFSFRGPFLQVEGADAFFRGAEGLRSIVRGLETRRQWEDGDDVSTLYELDISTPATAGMVLMSEWNTIRAGKIASALVVFDADAFRALVPGAGRG